MEKIVITGMGTVNPTGLSASESWDNIINGRSGIGPITHFDTTDWNIQIAGELKNFEPGKYMDPKEARRREAHRGGLDRALASHDVARVAAALACAAGRRHGRHTGRGAVAVRQGAGGHAGHHGEQRPADPGTAVRHEDSQPRA